MGAGSKTTRVLLLHILVIPAASSGRKSFICRLMLEVLLEVNMTWVIAS